MRLIQSLRIGLLGLLAVAAPLSAQQQDARADGKAFGQSLRGEAQEAARSQPNAANLPNYDRDAVQNLESLAGDPDRIESNATAAASGHQGYRAMRESVANRARFDPSEIEDVIARSLAINETPLDYTSGMDISGGQGNCVPLPPGSSAAGTYTATCNTGTRIDQSVGQCAVPLVASVTRRQQWHYLCNETSTVYGYPWCSAFDGGSCRITGYRPGPCLQWRQDQFYRYCTEPGDPIAEITCDTPDARYTPYAVTTDNSIDTFSDESQCTGFADNGDCTLDTEICTDADPQTRVIDGVSVTRPCWEWQRSYTCTSRDAATDCSDIESQGTCRFIGEECLTDETPWRPGSASTNVPCPVRTAPPSMSATAMSIASMAAARRSSAPPMTSSRMRRSHCTPWTRRAASSIRTR